MEGGDPSRETPKATKSKSACTVGKNKLEIWLMAEMLIECFEAIAKGPSWFFSEQAIGPSNCRQISTLAT